MFSSANTFRIGILISGRGSNMAALIDAAQSGMIPQAEVAVVITISRLHRAWQKQRARN